MDLRSNRLEPTVGCGLKIKFFGLEPTTPPLSPQYGKEKLSHTQWYKMKSHRYGFGIIFNKNLVSCGKNAHDEIRLGKMRIPQRNFVFVLLLLLDSSFPCCGLRGGVGGSEA